MRTILLTTYVVIIILVTYGLGGIFSYLNTGADRSNMLHTDIERADVYLPEINWAPLNNEGRRMDPEILKNLEKDYLNAWYVRNVVFKTNLTTGLDDYYTESARENIMNIVGVNSIDKTHIEGTTLEHHPSIEFFSEDGQLVVLTDRDVTEFKRIFKDDKLISEVNEKSTYKVILLLEDGFWRIRHIVRTQSEHLYEKSNEKPIMISGIKGINYYPQATPWNMFGEDFDPAIIASDFDIIMNSGLNSVRIFIPYEDFGKSEISNDKMNKLRMLLDMAEEREIKVLVTLFDFYGDYSVLDWTLTQNHAKAVINGVKNHNALLGWDVKNEPDLDFENRGRELVLSWLAKMIDFVKSEDPNHPVTVGWSEPNSALLLKDKLDFVSFHYYEETDNLEAVYSSVKTKIIDKPVIITEYGRSSYSGIWNPTGHSEEDQARYHEDIQKIFIKNNIQFMSWTLYDFSEIPKEVVGGLPWRVNAQKYYGFIDESGVKKPAFEYISVKE